MEAPIKTRYDKAGPQVAEALRRRHFEAHYVSTAQEALDLALTLIPKDRTVSWGGTATAQRFDIKTPCAVTGSCGDCTSSDCICCQMVITLACRPAGRIKVILVGEDLGF